MSFTAYLQLIIYGLKYTEIRSFYYLTYILCMLQWQRRFENENVFVLGYSFGQHHTGLVDDIIKQGGLYGNGKDQVSSGTARHTFLRVDAL